MNTVSYVLKMFDCRLEPCDTTVYAFNSSEPLPVLGKFKALVESKCHSVDSEFLVVDGKKSLLGYTTATNLGILQIANALSVEKNVFHSYPSLVSGRGKMKNVEVKLHIDENVRHNHQLHRHIPFNQQKNLEACVESLLQQDIIEPADGPTLWVSVDVIIYGVNTEEHDKTLHAVLTRFKELNLTLKKEKCQFYMPRIEFFGMVFSADGMSPDPAKVEAIKQAEAPTSVSDVRSLLGMTSYVSRFICDYADIIVAPLRDLTHKGVEFKWEDVHQEALERLRCSLASDEVITYFDPSSALLVDASPVGLGAVLTQSGKVISYASKALSSVERRHSQIEREALAITLGCHHFCRYPLGSHFKVVTDHKPLVSIFNSPTSQASARMRTGISNYSP